MSSGLQGNWGILLITGACWDIMGFLIRCMTLFGLYSKALIIRK